MIKKIKHWKIRLSTHTNNPVKEIGETDWIKFERQKKGDCMFYVFKNEDSEEVGCIENHNAEYVYRVEVSVEVHE